MCRLKRANLHPSEERRSRSEMKAIIFLLLLGALCFTTSLAEDTSDKKKKDREDELAFSQDDAIERALLQLFAKVQDKEEGDDKGKIQDEDDDDDLLALLQDEGDEGEAESVKEQDGDDDEGAAQLLKKRLRFRFPCRGRRCFSPYWKLKRMARKMISMGRQTTSMGGKMSSMSSTLIRDSRSMSAMAGQMKALGRRMSAFGRRLLFLHWPYHG